MSTLKRTVAQWLPEMLLLGLGLSVRAALYFPLAVFPLDSDGVLAGLCAFSVSQGHHPAFFPGGTRLSSASCYVANAFFPVAGQGRLALALTGMTWAALYLTFTLLFLRAALGRKTAWLAFLFAIVPSEQFVTITYIPWGYAEIAASCAATLWLAVLWRRDGLGWQRFWFGFSVGAGIWISLQTLMVLLPAIVWIVLRRRDSVLREAPAAIAGAVLGATPFWLPNALNGFPSLTHNWASRPVPDFAHAWDNLVWLVSYPLPGLLFHGFSGLESYALIGGFALAAVGLILDRRRGAGRSPLGLRDLCLLIALIVLTCIGLFVFSQAGSLRGWIVRYILPIYAVVPLFIGIGIRGLWTRSKVLATAAAVALVLPNLTFYSFPGTQERSYLTMWLHTDAQLRSLFAQRGVRMVYGDYFSVYHVNFDTQEAVAGVPTYEPADYMKYGERLGTLPVRWGMLGGQSDLRKWANDVGTRGETVKEGDTWLFIADHPAPNAAALLAKLHAACRTGSCTLPFPQ